MVSQIIHTQNLSRYFGEVHAVDDLSIDVAAGTIFGFLGPNGSGKTTTIRLLLGLIEPTSGSAQVFGKDTLREGEAIRTQSGALLEQTGLYERLSAEANLDFYARVWHLSSAERKSRIQELLTSLDLWDRRGEQVGGWSRGMKQKLAIARTLLHRPHLLFLDEPTAGLDPVASAALLEDIQQLVRQGGMTVFLTTHNLPEAEKLCDEVAVIRQGKLLSVGSPDALRKQGKDHRLEVTGKNIPAKIADLLAARPEVKSVQVQNDRVNIELTGDVDTSPLVQLLIGQGMAIDEVKKGKANLEEVFLELVKDNPA